ncbi:MAG TPA: hypothetical protein VEL28_22375 [Candidatus Binatia bacterium]|nr:hypothetical protein [Candidatus Binatia bacterium]
MKRSTVMAIVTAIVMMHGSASAVTQTPGQQKCINALNKGMAKVASAQNKANAKCISTRAKDGTTDAFLCANNDAKVAKAEAKTVALEAASCDELPTIGHTGAGNVNNRAQFQAFDFAQEIFDSNSSISLCDSDKAACKCQSQALKASNKLYKTHLKAYNKCKKAGLKDKTNPFDDDADFEACIGADPKGKIGKSASKLATTIGKKCGQTTTPFPQGRCMALTNDPLADCLDDAVRCHVCLTAALSDGLSVDCDEFDDGDDKNGSCFDDL